MKSGRDFFGGAESIIFHFEIYILHFLWLEIQNVGLLSECTRSCCSDSVF
jgi:hypothetical protein